MIHRLLVIDTETGGLDSAEHSILSLGAVIWNEGSIEAKFQVVIREPQMSTTLEALRINGFTHEIIENEGVVPLIAVQSLQNFLLMHDMRTRATLAGHNVSFDIGFLKRLYRLAGFGDKDYGKKFSHRALCTQTLAIALMAAGRCDFRSTGLNALCDYFNIVIREGGKLGRHDALEDATATAKLLTAELALIRDPSRDAFCTGVGGPEVVVPVDDLPDTG
jgi:DNA polymerase III epsilon subunit-like protein